MSAEHIALIGFMGAGKTTCGKILAEKLGLDFIDTDDYVEKSEGMSVAELFERHSERYFRDLEAAALKDALAHVEPHVIACGGGIVTLPANVAALQKRALIVSLTVEPEQALARFGDLASRPLLATAKSSDEIFSLMKARDTLYKATADFSISTDRRSAVSVVEAIIDHLEETAHACVHED